MIRILLPSHTRKIRVLGRCSVFNSLFCYSNTVARIVKQSCLRFELMAKKERPTRQYDAT